MPHHPSILRPEAAALGASAFSVLVTRRMAREYERQDSFTPTTVAALYSAYAATSSALAYAGLRRAWPLPLPRRPSRAIGIAAVIAGIGVSAAGMSRFSSGSRLTGVEPETLLTSGVYAHTRNPQYVGLSALLLGSAVAARSGLALATAAGAVAVLDRWIPHEEQHLSRVLGEDYLAYLDSVPRWW